MWDAIVCTCQNRESATSFRRELRIRQKKGLISSKALLLTIDDPKPNIGSGSATLNALICVAERLAALEGHKVVTADVFNSNRILILLLGTTFPFSPCGHAFMPQPYSSQPGDMPVLDSNKKWSGFSRTELEMNIDHLLDTLKRLCPSPPPGVWVCSTDMLLEVPENMDCVNLSGFENTVVAFTLRSSAEHAMLHGACKITESGEFAKISHLREEETVKPYIHKDGTCDMLSGIVYMDARVAETLLTLHTSPPLDACTYIGLDNGAQPLSLSLFFDILLCMTTEIDQNEYITGQFKRMPDFWKITHSTLPEQESSSHPLKPLKTRAREMLWKALRGTKMIALPLNDTKHYYLQYVASDVLTRYCPGNKTPVNDARVINSIIHPRSKIGKGSVSIHCNIQFPITVGKNCFLSGLSDTFAEIQATKYVLLPLTIPDNLAVQEIRVALGRGRMLNNHSVVVVYGVYDYLNKPYLADSHQSQATFCNEPWEALFKRTRIQASDLWLPGEPQTLLRAKLFVAAHTNAEVGIDETMWLVRNGENLDMIYRWRSAWRVSLMDILTCVDCSAEFSRMRHISFELQRQKMMISLKHNAPMCFLPFFKDSIIERREHDILKTLDDVVEEVRDNSLIVCRVYACIADMLGYMAGEAGIRAGPAANISWEMAFALLEEGRLLEATKALALERANWIGGGPDRTIRASRHYERAGQILTRRAVSTTKQFITGSPCSPPAIGQKVIATAPARVDLAGGWTDTPPLAYEWGGAVVTLALKINNEYPIKAIAERLVEPKLVIIQWSNDGTVLENIQLTTLSQLSDYSQPHAPGALLKSAFICAGIIEYPSLTPLEQQLRDKYGCGFKLQSYSNLPQGSGLGTSSILGGCVLAALWRASGEHHSNDSLIHAILHLEQLLTTGGGWQDQCGGLYGGAKMSRSQSCLPVHITTKQIQADAVFLRGLSDRLVLIYTGQTRLARNLLQDVLRNWHSREPTIVQTVVALVENAELAEKAIKRGDIEELGACLTRYQNHKLSMAPGSMPKAGVVFREKAGHLLHGCSFTGAGGGGFLAAIVKRPSDRATLRDIIRESAELADFVVYEAAIDDKGLVVDIQC